MFCFRSTPAFHQVELEEQKRLRCHFFANPTRSLQTWAKPEEAGSMFFGGKQVFDKHAKIWLHWYSRQLRKWDCREMHASSHFRKPASFLQGRSVST